MRSNLMKVGLPSSVTTDNLDYYSSCLKAGSRPTVDTPRSSPSPSPIASSKVSRSSTVNDKNALDSMDFSHRRRGSNNYQALPVTADNFLIANNFLLPQWSNYLKSYWERGIYPSSRLCPEPACLKKSTGSQGLCSTHRSKWRYDNDPVFRSKQTNKGLIRRKAFILGRMQSDPAFAARKLDLASRKITKAFGLGETRAGKKKLSPLQRRFNFCVLQTNRRTRKIIGWTISIDEFKVLIEQPCWYCDAPPGHTRFGSGLDRIDPQKGYHMDNVYPCCQTCNRLKSDKFTAQETKVMVTSLKIFRNSGQ